MTKLIDIHGQRFGSLVVVEYKGSGMWKCTCDCGNEILAQGSALRLGRKKSCGCMTGKMISESKKTHGHTHHDGYPSIYGVWKDMRKKCYKPSHSTYHLYGAFGIGVYSEWNSFEPFYEWAIASGYDDNNKYLHRVDITADFSPSNCYWANKRQILCKKDGLLVQKNNPVAIVSDDDAAIITFENIDAASAITGIPASSIYGVCHGRRHATHGLRFRYLNRDEEYTPTDENVLLSKLEEILTNDYGGDIDGEEWLQINGFDGYEVSNLGRVRQVLHECESLNSPRRRLVAQTDNGNGYKIVSLRLNGVRTNQYVHRLVAQLFVPNPDNKETVDHIDFNRGNNVASNLQWLTIGENVRRSTKRHKQSFCGDAV